MLKPFVLISAFFPCLVIFTSALGIDLRNTQPPVGSTFFEFMNQCGKENVCKKDGDIGCRFKREAKNKGDDYIKGGEDAPKYAYPWMVALTIQTNRKAIGGRQAVRTCTGTLISVRHILSARHCFVGSSGINKTTWNVRQEVGRNIIYAYLGAERVGNERTNFKYKAKKEVVEIKIPPNTFQDHDLALLRIKDVEFSDYIRPICLPFDGIPLSNNYYFAGYGAEDIAHPQGKSGRVYPNRLQQISGLQVQSVRQEWPIPVSSSGSFKNLPSSGPYEHNGTDVTTFFYFNITGHGHGHGIDKGTPCKGDSGGGLIWRDPSTERYFIMGVLWQAWNTDTNTKSIQVCSDQNTQKWRTVTFSKVSYFLDYIYREMNPDGFANNMCLSASCQDHDSTYITKDGLLSAPCGSIDNIGSFCVKGESRPVNDRNRIRTRNRRPNNKKEFLNNGYTECVQCEGGEKNWNYQQWINEITLGSFSQPRYHGHESPYRAFAKSYFKGFYEDED